MDEKKLRTIIQQGENPQVEFKEKGQVTGNRSVR